MRRTVVLLWLSAGTPGGLAAQSSLYGVLGIGIPGQPVSLRARALGQGYAAFDPGSAINPGSVAGNDRLTVTATSTTSFRRFTADPVSVGGLRQTRFPFALLGTRVGGSRLSLAVSFSPYLDRTFDIASSDTLELRGNPVAVSDRIASDGAVTDIRFALGWRLTPRVDVGVGIHALSGSAKLTTRREFSDSAFRPLSVRQEESFSGAGVSVGAVVRVLPRLNLAAAIRSDTHLSRQVDSVPARPVDLPIALTAGLLVVPRSAIRWSTTVTRRFWSVGTVTSRRAFDTWEVGSGIEVGGPDIGASRIPLRVGVRYAQLPFSPTSDQPTEWAVGGGTALPFAGNRALITGTLERIFRDGAGASERVWALSFGLTVRP